MQYSNINNMSIGTGFQINNGVNAVKSSKDTVVLDNGSTYRLEPIGENVKFVKLI